jgi:hypothetical protein
MNQRGIAKNWEITEPRFNQPGNAWQLPVNLPLDRETAQKMM